MGFGGEYVLARSDRPLRELAGFAAGCAEGHSDCVTECLPRPGGWQTLQIHHGLPGDSLRPFRQLADSTGAPVLIARVMDSDVCEVVGLAPSGARWSTYLDPAMAADYGFPEPPPGAAGHITRWAAEAGCTADPIALAEVLAKRADSLVDDLIFDLIDACGFPPSVPTEAPASA
ncbi:hypothetical protein TR51_12805 [Kitasatospora griseola]|uniref:Uncharacterized protein n=1 Tax=Kitasatospora griseola TaxID=2064 RepID=A0A0D0PQV7_KITGR|nr:hypothetical protein [Kitasatospora griseola]KIQ64954.1 hypothetical protein TR51_12805 [Kitasatospora griseola]